MENDFVADMVAVSREILSKAGYVPYYMYRQKYQAGNNENVGWTKPGKACIYNVDVMEETTDNIAVGANAVSLPLVPPGKPMCSIGSVAQSCHDK